MKIYWHYSVKQWSTLTLTINGHFSLYSKEFLSLLLMPCHCLTKRHWGKILTTYLPKNLHKQNSVTLVTTSYKVHYTANISTAKSTGFTYVPFSPVLSLSFLQSTNAGNESLYFDCTSKCFPNFTTFTCYFDIFIEKKITAYYLSKIHSVMT